MHKNQRGSLLVALFALGFLVRVLMAMRAPTGPLDGDAIQYDALAHSLSNGDGFRFTGVVTAIRPPIYPAFLAIIYSLFGYSILAVRIAQAAVEGVTVVLTYEVGRFFSSRVALISALLICFQPALITQSTFILTETVYTLILTATILVFLHCQRRLSTWLTVWAGILMGLGTLCRPTGLGLPAVFILGCAFLDQKRIRLRLAILAAIVAAITAIPWTVRNAVQMKAFIPVSNSSFGTVIWIGTYVPWDLTFKGWDAPPLDKLLHGLHPVKDATAIDRILLGEAYRNVRSAPFTNLWFSVRKVWNLWRPTPGDMSQAFNSVVLFWSLRTYHVLLVTLCIVGIAIGRWIGARDVWSVGLLLYWTLLHAVTLAIPRYLLPVLPVVAIYASVPVAALWERYFGAFEWKETASVIET